MCSDWQSAVDTFLDTHPSKVIFDKETQLNEIQKLERGRVPTWKESPLNILTKAYKFSDLKAFDNFISRGKGKIVGSTVWLDNLALNKSVDVTKIKRFLSYFGKSIRYLTISYGLGSPYFSIKPLLDRLKLCLESVPNLIALTLVFSVADEYEEASPRCPPFPLYNSWEVEKINKNLKKGGNYFPKLEKLESIVIDGENLDMQQPLSFFSPFSETLRLAYSKQLKMFGILTKFLRNSNTKRLNMPHLHQLTIAITIGGFDWKYGYKNLEKFTIIYYDNELHSTDFVRIQTNFRKLVCLCLKVGDSGEELKDFSREMSPPKLHSVLVLELENFQSMQFSLLVRFPNVRYIKLVNSYTNKVNTDVEQLTSDSNTSVNITLIWKGSNLYESKLFWEDFPNVSVVTLEFKGNPLANVDSKLLTWTRRGYNQYWYHKGCRNLS